MSGKRRMWDGKKNTIRHEHHPHPPPPTRTRSLEPSLVAPPSTGQVERSAEEGDWAKKLKSSFEAMVTGESDTGFEGGERKPKNDLTRPGAGYLYPGCPWARLT